MDYMMLEPYTNEFKGFVSDKKVMDELRRGPQVYEMPQDYEVDV